MFNPRIITGKYKGLALKVPDSARPVTDRVKKTIFDVLGAQIKGTKILDIFAGSGSLGIEALSNGAESGTFNDQDQQAVDFLKINTSRITEPVEIVMMNYRMFLKKADKKFDLIFIDPPFAKILEFRWDLVIPVLKDNGIIIFKADESIDKYYIEGLEVVDSRKIGINYIYFLAKQKN